MVKFKIGDDNISVDESLINKYKNLHLYSLANNDLTEKRWVYNY